MDEPSSFQDEIPNFEEAEKYLNMGQNEQLIELDIHDLANAILRQVVTS